jgi:hypothetical protein
LIEIADIRAKPVKTKKANSMDNEVDPLGEVYVKVKDIYD